MRIELKRSLPQSIECIVQKTRTQLFAVRKECYRYTRCLGRVPLVRTLTSHVRSFWDTSPRSCFCWWSRCHAGATIVHCSTLVQTLVRRLGVRLWLDQFVGTKTNGQKMAHVVEKWNDEGTSIKQQQRKTTEASAHAVSGIFWLLQRDLASLAILSIPRVQIELSKHYRNHILTISLVRETRHCPAAAVY